MAALVALFPVIHLIFGLIMICAPVINSGTEEPTMALIGGIVGGLALCIITVGLVLAGCVICAGRFLTQRKHYQDCLVMAGVECIFMPFGTVLGVFTILVLMRDSVKQRFQSAAAVTPPSQPTR